MPTVPPGSKRKLRIRATTYIVMSFFRPRCMPQMDVSTIVRCDT